MAKITIEVELDDTTSTATDVRRALNAAADRLDKEWGTDDLRDTASCIYVIRVDNRPVCDVRMDMLAAPEPYEGYGPGWEVK